MHHLKQLEAGSMPRGEYLEDQELEGPKMMMIMIVCFIAYEWVSISRAQDTWG